MRLFNRIMLVYLFTIITQFFNKQFKFEIYNPSSNKTQYKTTINLKKCIEKSLCIQKSRLNIIVSFGFMTIIFTISFTLFEGNIFLYFLSSLMIPFISEVL